MLAMVEGLNMWLDSRLNACGVLNAKASTEAELVKDARRVWQESFKKH